MGAAARSRRYDMFILYKTVEAADGQLQTLVHGAYHHKADAEHIGDNLRLLYSWVKSVCVEVETDAAVAAAPPLPLSRKKMAASKTRTPDEQRKIS